MLVQHRTSELSRHQRPRANHPDTERHERTTPTPHATSKLGNLAVWHNSSIWNENQNQLEQNVQNDDVNNSAKFNEKLAKRLSNHLVVALEQSEMAAGASVSTLPQSGTRHRQDSPAAGRPGGQIGTQT
jgi:hypothetical protein